jgi:hypothetical protein
MSNSEPIFFHFEQNFNHPILNQKLEIFLIHWKKNYNFKQVIRLEFFFCDMSLSSEM